MSTTSSSRPDAPALLPLLLLLAGGCAPASPGDAPVAPARSELRRDRPERADREATPQHRRPAHLRRVAARRMGAGLSRVAGRGFAARATDPVVIEVRLMEPIDARPRDSAPVIVLNGSVLTNTYARVEAPDQLVAFLPDRSLLKAQNEVRVQWAGNAEASRSPAPLTFAISEVDD